MKLLLVSCLIGLGFQGLAQNWVVSVPQKLIGDINTGNSELGAILSKDSNSLYFTRINNLGNETKIVDQDIYVSVKDHSTGLWGKSEPVKGLNNTFKNAIVGFSKDGNTVYLLDAYEGKKDNFKGLAYATKQGKYWSTPIHFPIEGLDIEGDFYGFHMNEAENVIIISYKGPGSIGEEDLYASFKQGSKWSAPIHLGNNINTSGYEMSPYLNSNSDTLYFSSNGMGGLGDADIFFSVRQDDTWLNWSKPTNLGEKINSAGFDAYFSIFGNSMYWSSNREGNEDIYFVQKVAPPKLEVAGTSSGITTFHGADGKVDVTIKGGVPPYQYHWSNGAVTEDLENVPDGEYLLEVTDAVNQKIVFKAVVESPKITTGMDLAKMLTPAVVIYFNLGSWEITPQAAAELDRVVAVMNENPNLVVELGSHTDCRSTAAFNLQLSQNRAASTAAYIKARISNPARLYGKGYGESRLITNCPCEGPVKSSCPESEHQKNRRTEFLVKSNDATKIPKVDNTTPKIVPIKKKEKESNGVAPSNSTVVASNEQKDNIAQGFYIVQKGETLYRVHVNTGVSLEELKRLNNLKTNDVRPGTKLQLHNDSPSTSAPAVDQSSNIAQGFYIVQKGETLYRVFKNTGVPLDQLRRLNNLKANEIKTGQKLRLK